MHLIPGYYFYTKRHKWRCKVGEPPYRQSMSALIVLFCTTLLFGDVALGEHIALLKWMAPYRSANGASCCGVNDCFRAQVTLVSEPAAEYVSVLVHSLENRQHQKFLPNAVVIVPSKSIHRSEDSHSWYCSNLHFRTWNALGEETNQSCYTDKGFKIISECARCIFVNVGA